MLIEGDTPEEKQQSLEDITREISFLLKNDHPNIVKCDGYLCEDN